jgi:3-hydroxybutyryl-CoA dehydrogenase
MNPVRTIQGAFTLSLTSIKHILVIGAGTMGQQIGLQCAMHGFDVTLYDIELDALQTALKTIEGYAGGLAEAGRLSAGEAEAALARIATTTDPQEAATGADLVSESVPEDPALKGKVFAQFNALCPPHTIFTTNTSSLVPSLIAEATGRPAQFAALHFHQPVWDANLADVMPHPGTSADTLAQLEAFARQIGQVPIVLGKENYGYVFNAMYNALNREAITLAANGVASVEDIDRAWMVVMKMPVGPLGMLDVVGLETAWHITDYWANTLGDPQLQTNAAFLKTYVDKGWLGVKTGRGFYTYPDPAYAQPDFLEGQ